MKRKRLRWTRMLRTLFVISFLWMVYQLTLADRWTGYDLPLSKEEMFIEELAPYAQDLSKEYRVLPSIVMAQAILESDWGESDLATEEKNYFGVKGNKDDPLYETAEYEEVWEIKDQNFRSYESMYESMRDYAKLLQEGTTWNPNQYHAVLSAENYKDAAQEIQKAGYATDPDYADKLIEIIEVYNLDRYDYKMR